MYLWRDEGIGKQLDAVGESWRWYFAHHGVQSTSELYNHVFCFLTQKLMDFATNLLAILRSCRVALTIIIFPRGTSYVSKAMPMINDNNFN